MDERVGFEPTAPEPAGLVSGSDIAFERCEITLDIYTQAVTSEKALANGRATDLLLAGTLSTLGGGTKIRYVLLSKIW